MPTKPSRMRLAPDVRPREYDLHLTPDLGAGTFRGEVSIATALAKTRKDVTLHAADLTISRAVAHVNGTAIAARASVQKHDEAVTLRFAKPLPKGDVRLELQYAGKLNTHLRGLYAASANGKPYAFTQCETADARRIVPCFDEPSFKAVWRVAVTAPAGDTVLGNAPVEREEPAGGGGARTVRFAPTPPLSSYLLALAIGPLEATEARYCGTTPVRVWHVEGKGHLAAFGLDAGVEALRRLEGYFGIPYPYTKLDLVAVPDFEAGAMENAGAVFFRETLLLLDPATVSIAERRRAAEVIAHELAHMWYGDLVTMAWWDDLWLNEAFATWMAYKVVDDWKPEWRMWQGFEHDRAGALALDALANTHPIYAPVHSVAEATENFDLITYEKGAAVVRMIEHYLGADAFRDGVRRYMERHREGNTVAADLWRALEEASGKEVARVAKAWITQPGFPLVSIDAGAKGVTVKQERFFADPKIPAAKRRTRWPVPLVARLPGGTLVRGLADKPAQPLDLPGARPAWVYGNASAGGFYRVRHDEATRAALVTHLGELSAVERLALAGDQWALVRAGKAPVESWLGIIDALGDETDYDVLDGIVGPMGFIDEQVAGDGTLLQVAYRRWLTDRFSAAFARLGWRADAGEHDDVRLRRAALLRIIGLVAEAPDVMHEASRLLERYLVDRASLEPNLADPVVHLGARIGSLGRYRRYREVVAEARTPQERRRFLLALASFRNTEAIDETLAATLTPDIPTQDVAFILMRLLANPEGQRRTWAFMTKKWTALRKRMPPLMLARLVEATPSLREPRYAREVRDFFKKHPLPEAARALRQAMEVFRLNAELRKRATPGLEKWLATRGAGPAS